MTYTTHSLELALLTLVVSRKHSLCRVTLNFMERECLSLTLSKRFMCLQGIQDSSRLLFSYKLFD